jgi:CheY-like chemotaxis protein
MAEEAKGAVRALEASERRDRVLIVEDEDNARKGYEQLLQRWGCEVLGVSNAEDALAKFATFQPDALIADVELPGMNGLDLLRQLGPELHDVPAIIITGHRSRGVLVHRKTAERPGSARIIGSRVEACT